MAIGGEASSMVWVNFGIKTGFYNMMENGNVESPMAWVLCIINGDKLNFKESLERAKLKEGNIGLITSMIDD